jgi:RHS repeat-associated protein
VTGETDTGLPGGNQSYTYSPLEQLRSDGSASWYDDPAGNPIRAGAAGSQTFDPANQLTSSQNSTGPTLAAGGYHTVTIRQDGTVWAAGVNNDGQIGPNSPSGSVSDYATEPVEVTGLPSNGAEAVTAGNAFSAALMQNGQVWAWGDNSVDELGDGAAGGTSPTPKQVETSSGPLTGITAISAAPGGSDTLAVTSTGGVEAWGYNGDDQLGDNSTTNSDTAVVPTGITEPIVAVSAGAYHSLALAADGTIWAWGYNGSGQLGDGTTTTRTVPEHLSSTSISGVVAIAAGSLFSLALKADGTVWAWGDNSVGEQGNGTTSTTPITTPTKIASLAGVTAISAGALQGLAIESGGTLWSWGGNADGQVGGTAATVDTPTEQSTGSASVLAVSAGFLHSTAVLSNADVDSWGYNAYGQLANGTTTNADTPTDSPGWAETAQLAGGGFHTVSIRADGTVWAAGLNNDGQIGSNSPSGSTSDYTALPVPVAGLSGAATQVTANWEDSGALIGGHAWVWGDNTYDELGDGTAGTSGAYSATPEEVTTTSGPLGGVTDISMSPDGLHGLAVAGGAAYAWGYNGSGQLGNGNTGTNSADAVAVSGITGTVTQVAAGGRFSLALTSDGSVWAWGANTDGQLGDGTTTSRNTAEKLTGISGVAALAAGDSYSLALTTSGTVYSWGDNTYDELGGSPSNPKVPNQISGLTGVTHIAAGSYQALALGPAANLYSWGLNNEGQTGTGASGNTATPTLISNTGAVSISAGYAQSLAGYFNGETAAWGYNIYGQLGTGTTTNATVPSGSTGFGSTSEYTYSYSYNTRGDQTTNADPYTGTVFTYSYDQDNRLTDATATIGGPAYSYTYTSNGDGQRMTTTNAGITQNFVWDQTATQIISDTTNDYIYGPNGPLEQINTATGTVTWLHTDQQGSVRALTNSTGTLIGANTYNPYGGLTATSGTATSPLGYTGAYTDPDGLIYLVNREYDPGTGQFLSRDPLVGLTRQPYSYVNDNPLNGTDPLGLSWYNPASWSAKTWDNIASVAAVVAVLPIPGVDVVAGAIAVGAGSVGAAEDAAAGNWGGAALGVVGVGLSAFGVGEALSAARDLDAAAGAVNGYGYLSSMYEADAATARSASVLAGRLGLGFGAVAFGLNNFIGGPGGSSQQNRPGGGPGTSPTTTCPATAANPAASG